MELLANISRQQSHCKISKEVDVGVQLLRALHHKIDMEGTQTVQYQQGNYMDMIKEGRMTSVISFKSENTTNERKKSNGGHS